tara:strand:+ start:78 stop:269 length:192 start_codon:yes stop_codon:yes gene_type:complete
MTVSAVDGREEGPFEQELKKLVNGILVADAAKLAADIFLMNSRLVLFSFIFLKLYMRKTHYYL